MKTITLPVYNRPQYLDKCLQSLKRNKLDDYTLVVNVEPGSKEVDRIVDGVDFMKVVKFKNEIRYGLGLNLFLGVERAIQMGTNFNIYIEDDLEVAPDATRLADWFLQNKNGFGEDCVGLGFRSVGAGSDLNSVRDDQSHAGLLGVGFCFTREDWLLFFRRYWWYWDEKCPGPYKFTASQAEEVSWDWVLGHMIERHKKILLRPDVSRTRHIGVHGTNACGVFNEVVSGGDLPSEPQTEFRLRK